MRVTFLALLLVASACARAGSSHETDATPVDTKAIDAAIDGNGCATQPCSILPQCGCGGGKACDLDTSDNNGTACRSVTMPGTETSTCNSLSQCAAGYICLGGGGASSCKKYCTSDTDCGTPRGACVIDITSGGTPVMGIPSACSSNCEPTATNSPECPSTYKCGLFTASHMGNNIRIADCSPAGTGTQGSSCASGANGDDKLCAKGYLCSTTTSDTAFKCRRICQKAASNCGAATCISFNPIFTIGTPPVEYGICQ